jgi:thioredoxin-dependent peroxiredoxin
MQERKGVITFQGNPLTLRGPEIKVGDKAPSFTLLNNQLQPVGSDAYKGKTLLLSVAPSLDTPVCQIQTRRFNQELKTLPAGTALVTVTADLPFAQGRFCGAEGLVITTLSDHRDMSFGDAYGTHISELRLETRALFVVGKDGLVKYAQYVKEITEEPDYAPTLAALKANA